MSADSSKRPWYYGDGLPLPILVLLWPVYLLAMAVLFPVVVIGMLFGLHLPRDKNDKRTGDGLYAREPDWMGRDPGSGY